MPPNSGSSGGPWGRLKPVETDPLESIGLPSKGDTRLLDLKFQERFYTKIVERYLSFCSEAGDRDSLLERFSSLNLSEDKQRQPPPPPPAKTQEPTLACGASTISITPKTSSSIRRDLSSVLSGLRKLREGIVATRRTDPFAVQSYLFSIRAAILAAQPDSYHPALLHLLRAMPLSPLERTEAAAYLILDAACRRGDLAEARRLRSRYALCDARVDTVLSALADDNWVAFRRVSRIVDGHQARLMGWAEGRVRQHALKCFGRAYLSVDVGYLERSTGRSWEELKAEDAVGWELDGQRVVIRKIKGKT